MLALRLPEDIEARLSALASATGRTKSFRARQAILEYLDDMEDLYSAERRLADIRAGDVKPMPLDALMRAHGLAD
jgi:RHH-type rel operon transcriptional repressor/antitoxin RelB